MKANDLKVGDVVGHYGTLKAIREPISPKGQKWFVFEREKGLRSNRIAYTPSFSTVTRNLMFMTVYRDGIQIWPEVKQ